MHIRLPLSALVATMLISVGTAWAQEDFVPPKPTEQHAVLKQDVGDWDAEMVAWMAGPESEPMRSKGSERNRLLGNGMWLLSDFQGSFAGMQFSGHATMGYDPIKKKYIGTWVDSMNPHLMTIEGTYDAKTRTMTTYSEGVEPQTGEVAKGKSVVVYKKDGTRVMTMYMAAPDGSGKFVKAMQITYRRKK